MSPIDILFFTTGVLTGGVFAAALAYMLRHRNTPSHALECSECKRYEEKERQEGQRRLNSLFENDFVGLYCNTLDGTRYLTANQFTARLAGYDTVEEFLAYAKPLDFHTRGSDREQFIDILRRTGRIGNLELSLKNRHGEMLPVMISARIDYENDCIEGLVQDLRPLKTMERQLGSRGRFLQTLLDALPTPLFYKSTDGIYRHCNVAFSQALGLSMEDIIGKTVHEISPEGLAQQYAAADEELFKASGPAVQRYEFTLESSEGRRTVIFNKETVFDESGQLIGIVGLITDITNRKRMETELTLARENYHSIFMSAMEGLFTSHNGRFLEVNKAMADMFGYASTREMRKSVTSIRNQLFVIPADSDRLLQQLESEGVVPHMETLLRRKDGNTIWVRLRMTAEQDSQGVVRRVHGLASDITRQKEDTERLQHEASTDSLTGLFNRGYLLTCFRGMLARAKRSDRNVGLLFIDLDGFKQINDEHGHQVGDAILRKIAGAIRETMCRDDFAARLGGDEFAVLLWDIKDQKALRLAAQKTHNAVCGNYQTEAGTFSIGLSIGASLYPDHGKVVEELLNTADKAMYRCKTAEYLDVCVAETP